MRAVIQRVREASVEVDKKVIGEIKVGLLVFIGFEEQDAHADMDWLASKIIQLRIFNDAQGVMNHSLKDVAGELLVVSQFTLHALTKKGNRPSYIRAAKPEMAKVLYQEFIAILQERWGATIQTGEFGADMKVSLCNDGPVTIWFDTKNKE